MAEDSLNTVGKVTFLISIFFNLLGNLLIARLEGLILSPPKLSNPVIRIRILKFLVILGDILIIKQFSKI